jgi:putative NADH-flavin reductase
MSHVLIIGASKGIGFEAVRGALASGHNVRAFARSANRIKLAHPHLEKRRGDALNPEDIQSALNGMDIVIQALGIGLGPHMIFGPVRIFSDATRILVPAMETAGIKRLVCITGFGAGDSRASVGCAQCIPFRIVFGRAYDDKDVQERIIRNSRLDWTIVRPGVLTNGTRTGRYRVLDRPDQWQNGLISRADVADFLVRQINDDTYVGKAPVLIY